MGLQESLASGVRPSLIVMLAAVGLLLLIACANTASLLLARAAARGREAAMRAALGAGRGRIIRQMLTESLLIAMAGGILGLLLAYWSVPALLALTPSSYLITDDVRIDGTVLAATLLLVLGTGIVFGLAPALSLSRQNLVEAFKDDARDRGLAARRVAAERARHRGNRHLHVAAGRRRPAVADVPALARRRPRFRSARRADRPRVAAGRAVLDARRRSTRLYDEGLERIRRIPGVRAAAVVNGVPLERALNLNVDVLDGPEKFEDELTDWRYASPDYFTVLRAPIVAGRGFTEADRAGSAAGGGGQRAVRPAVLQGIVAARPAHSRLRRRWLHRDRRGRARSEGGRPAAGGRSR